MAEAEISYGYEDDNDDVEVELTAEEAELQKLEASIEYSDDDPNLVETFLAAGEAGKNVLKRISRRICYAFDAAHQATDEYRQRCARDWRLLVGELEKPTFPFEDCAAVHIPSFTEMTVRLTFRAENELFGDWRDVFKVSSMGADDDAIAEVMTIHDNWQLRNKVVDFKRQLRRGLLAFFAFGDVTYHVYWDELRKTNVPEMLTPDNFVMPYTYNSSTPDLSDLPWYAKIFHRYRHELQAMREAWHGVDRVIKKAKPSWDDEPKMEIAEAVREVHGVTTPDDTGGPAAEESPNAPYRLVHWEGWLELPSQEVDRFCCAVFDPNTKALMYLKIHEEPDWQEKMKFDAQTAELEMYSAAFDAYEKAQQVFDINLQTVSADADARVVAGVLDPMGAEAEKATVAAQAPQAPLPPEWLTEDSLGPTPPRSVPIRMFRRAVFMEPLHGNLGYGYGRILADMNIAQDTMMRQFIDATTLNNSGVGFTSAEVELPDDFGWKPGKFFRVEGVTASQLQNAILPFKTPPPSDGLLTMVGQLQNWMSAVAQAPDVLSGAKGPSGETFRGHASRIEQATLMLAVPTRKFAELVTEILKCNAKLNSIYLEDDEVVQVTDMPTVLVGNDYLGSPGAPPPAAPPMGPPMDPSMMGQHMMMDGSMMEGPMMGPQMMGAPPAPQNPYIDPATKMLKVGRWMWERNYHVEIQSDLRFTSRAQRIQEADEIVSLGQHPVLMGNMQYQIVAVRKALEARGRKDMAQLVVPPPPPPMMPGGPPGMAGPGPSEATSGPPPTQGGPPMGPPSAGPTGPNGPMG